MYTVSYFFFTTFLPGVVCTPLGALARMVSMAVNFSLKSVNSSSILSNCLLVLATCSCKVSSKAFTRLASFFSFFSSFFFPISPLCLCSGRCGCPFQIYYLPLNSGVRFSTNAAMPSFWSSEANVR